MSNTTQSKRTTRSVTVHKNTVEVVRRSSAGKVLTEGYQPRYSGTVVIPQKTRRIVSASGSAKAVRKD